MQLLTDTLIEIIEENEGHFTTFAQQAISFEEWLNIELCVALCNTEKVKLGSVENTPNYINDSKRLDITYKTTDDKKTALEIKIAHPGTYESYKEDCKNDLKKLAYASDCENRYFLLVVVSTLTDKEFVDDQSWSNWINEIFSSKVPESNSKRLKNGCSVHFYISQRPYIESSLISS